MKMKINVAQNFYFKKQKSFKKMHKHWMDEGRCRLSNYDMLFKVIK